MNDFWQGYVVGYFVSFMVYLLMSVIEFYKSIWIRNYNTNYENSITK